MYSKEMRGGNFQNFRYSVDILKNFVSSVLMLRKYFADFENINKFKKCHFSDCIKRSNYFL